MSGNEVDDIIRKLDGLEKKVDCLQERLDARDDADALRAARIDGRKDIVRWGILIYKSDFARWIAVAGVVMGIAFQ